MFKKHFAYTLSEVVLAICIIAVVVAVSVRIHRRAVDISTSLEYYNMYSTLKTAAAEMIKRDDQGVYILPDKGEDFCKSFAKRANTAQLSQSNECEGAEIADNETSFSGKTPDIILRNGMRIYNASQDFKKILDGNLSGITYDSKDIDEYGYLVYVDLNGSNIGENELWDDVFPFYVTLSGKVVPAYNDDNLGGNDKSYLQVSVSEESTEKVTWVAKSVTFKEGACKMGYVNKDSDYCKKSPAIDISNTCNNEQNDCKLKVIIPLKSAF